MTQCFIDFKNTMATCEVTLAYSPPDGYNPFRCKSSLAYLADIRKQGNDWPAGFWIRRKTP